MSKTSGTREWADRTCNIQAGCEHDCRYCYAKAMAIRFGRATAQSWREPGIACVKKTVRHKWHGVTMFPSAHDVTELNAEQCGEQVGNILIGGDMVLLVTKARLVPLVRAVGFVLSTQRKAQVEVRVTIGSASDAVLKYWEPGAPTFGERLEALRWAAGEGFRTSVSMEPLLDDDPFAVIDRVREFAGVAWIGRANNLKQTVAVNCPGDMEAKARAFMLEKTWDDEAVLKLYLALVGDPLIAWKDSVRQVVEKKGKDE